MKNCAPEAKVAVLPPEAFLVSQPRADEIAERKKSLMRGQSSRIEYRGPDEIPNFSSRWDADLCDACGRVLRGCRLHLGRRSRNCGKKIRRHGLDLGRQYFRPTRQRLHQ